MTQPVAPGSRTACFDESDPTVPCPAAPPPLCAEGLDALEVSQPQGASPSRPAPAEPWGLRFCREADTVVEGFLCNEPTVVSNACRKPNNAVDAYICDEPRMHALQDKVWKATLSVIKAILSEILRRGQSG